MGPLYTFFAVVFILIPFVQVHHYYKMMEPMVNINRPIFVISCDEGGEYIGINYPHIYFAQQGEEWKMYQWVCKIIKLSKNIFYNQKLKGLYQLPVEYLIFQDAGNSTETWEEFLYRVRFTIEIIVNNWDTKIKHCNTMYFFEEVHTTDNITFDFFPKQEPITYEET